MSSVQADIQRWKTLETEYNTENMEEDVTDVGNATTSVPMSITPPTSAPYYVFGETSGVRLVQPTASQTMPLPVTFPPSFVDLAIRPNTYNADFNPSFFTIPKSGEAQGSTITGIPIIPDEIYPGIQSEEAPHIDEV